MSPRFRSLAPEDASEVAALHAAAAGEGWSVGAWETLLQDPVMFGFAAEQDDAAIGIALARAAGGEGEILMVAVAHAFRRRGVARGLVARALMTAAARGAETMHLEVADGNEAAVALYRGLGFIDAGRRIGYYLTAGGAVDARIMSCRLEPER